MSKFVCNVAKFKGGQLYGMDIHIQRKTENHTNKDIDISRSNLNYELVNGFQNQHYFTAVQNRIKDGYAGTKSLRKDATLACGILISSDKKFFDGLTEEQERDFFKTAYEYLCEKYGKENIISAKVHKDETTPHLHAIVVPLTKDGRLTAKELFDRKALTALHSEMPRRLKQLGFDLEKGENTGRKRIETADYKKMLSANTDNVTINASDTEPLILEKKFLSTITETPEMVAERLSKKYIAPLTEEIAKLRTDLQLREQHEKRLLNSRKFQKEQGFKSDFLELYENLKTFGDTHVKYGLEQLKSVVRQLNYRKKEELEQREKQSKEQAEQKQRETLAKQYKTEFGGELAQVADYGKSPLNFEENGEKSFYIVAQMLASGQFRQFWGLALQELGLRNKDVIEIKDDKIHRATALNRSISSEKTSSGMKV